MRADERQWILRRSSPVRYSRVDASSAPWAPTEWLPAFVADVVGPRRLAPADRVDDRGDDELAGRGERAQHVDQTERVGEPHAQRAGPVAAARQVGHPVGHRAVSRGCPARRARTAPCRRRRPGAGPRASASPVGSQRAVGQRSGASAPVRRRRWSPGRRARCSAKRSRERCTTQRCGAGQHRGQHAGAEQGRLAPSSSPHSTAVMPAASRQLPRVVSPGRTADMRISAGDARAPERRPGPGTGVCASTRARTSLGAAAG